MSALWPVQQALYARMTADAPLVALVSGIYDEVPEKVPAGKPYIAFAELTEKDISDHGRRAFEVMATLNIWSAYRGFAANARVLAELDRVLHRVALDVPGWELISIARIADGVRRVNDPNIRQGQARFRVWVQEQEM
ncbi:DUF3168 domain-containing protein [Streptosporangium sp. DT93]|uniref:DUF3168 domain-containing protein n=1 Tax=Streptosporangium sp. DT93 TaxID=3393428 RepID=UPI003CE746B2